MKRFLFAGLLSLSTLLIAAENRGLNQTQPARKGPPTQIITSSNKAEVAEDDLGIWRISGVETVGMWEALGYESARNRMWQMEMLRRAAWGALAEVFGPDFLDHDIWVRRRNYTRDEYLQAFTALNPETRTLIEAYAAGLNRRLDEVRRDDELMPLEFIKHGFQPQGWDRLDIAAISVWLCRGLSAVETDLRPLANAALLQQLLEEDPGSAAAKFEDLLPRHPTNQITVIPNPTSNPLLGSINQDLNNLRSDIDFQALYRKLQQQSEARTQSLIAVNVDIKGDGFAWAVSPQKTGSQDVLLHVGLQIGFNTPSAAFEGILRGAGFEVSGMMVPGFPFFLIGRNQNLAWSVSRGTVHDHDYYLEDVAIFQSEPHHVENIAVLGQEPYELAVYRGQFGPIIDETIPLSWRYAAWGFELRNLEAFKQVAQAADLEAFSQAVSRFSSGFHVLYGDRRGHIAFWQSGRQPIRPEGEFRLPQGVLGTALDYDPTNLEPTPQILDPDQGFLASWNQPGETNRFRPGSPGGPFHRAHLLHETLSRPDPFQNQQSQALATDLAESDSPSRGGHPWTFLAPYIMSLLEDESGQAATTARQLLTDWDGTFTLSSGASGNPHRDRSEAWMLADTWLEIMTSRLLPEPTAQVDWQTRLNLLIRLLPGPNQNETHFPWLGEDQERGAQSLVLESLEEAVQTLGERPWGENRRGEIRFQHGSFWEFAAVPFGNRAAYQQIVNLAPQGPRRIETQQTLGQSGHIQASRVLALPQLDPNYLSMFPYFEQNHYRPFPLPNQTPAVPDLLAAAITAMGGAERIFSLNSRQITAKGVNFSPSQAFQPGNWFEQAADYQFTLSHDISGNRFHFNWFRAVLFPARVDLNYNEAWDHDRKKGWVQGRRVLFFELEAETMYEKHMVYSYKRTLMSSPALLLRHAAAATENIQTLADQTFEQRPHQVLRINELFELPVDLWIDSETKRISKVETREDDWMYGDQIVETYFREYRNVDGLLQPFQLEHRIRGHLIKTEERETIILNPELDPNLFQTPDFIPPSYLDFFPEPPALGIKLGDLRSNQYQQYMAHGVPFTELDFRAASYTLANLESPVVPNVHLVSSTTHNVLVVEMRDFILIAGPAGYPQALEILLDKVKRKFPGKEIRYTVLCHAHFDHAGGMRAAMAEESTILTRAYNVGIVEDTHQRPRTILPDRLERNPKPLHIQTIEEKTVISDGNLTVELIPWDSPHAEGSLFIHIPEHGIIYTDDVIVPGFYTADLLNQDPRAPMSARHLEWGQQLVFDELPKHNITPQLFLGGHGVPATLEDILIAFSNSPILFKGRSH